MAEITSGDNLTVMVLDEHEVNALSWILKKGVTAIEAEAETGDINGLGAIADAFSILESFDISSEMA
jgi:hypothetical protein